jgi:hypothetical protein
MKCTECSAVVKPVVAHDIDGSLGDFHGHFLEFAQEYLGSDLRHISRVYDGTVPFREWFCGLHDVTEASWRQIKLAYRQGGMKRTMPAYDSSRNIVKYIRSQGIELWLTTSRPAYRLDNIDPDTLEWCRRNNIKFDHLLYDDDKYDLLSQQVEPERVIAVFDDLYEMYDVAAERFGSDVPILVKGHWNRGVSRPNEVPNGLLTQTAHIVGQRLQAWKKEYA